MDDTLLPTTIDNQLSLPSEPLEHEPVLPEYNVTEVVAIDLQISNYVVKRISQAWDDVQSIHQVISLSRATFDALKSRRELLLMQYGSDNRQSSRSDVVIPFD